MVVQDHLKFYERLQTAEEDQKFLKFEASKIEPTLKYAVIYRMERKRILHS